VKRPPKTFLCIAKWWTDKASHGVIAVPPPLLSVLELRLRCDYARLLALRARHTLAPHVHTTDYRHIVIASPALHRLMDRFVARVPAWQHPFIPLDA
jgi:hypothetical protein